MDENKVKRVLTAMDCEYCIASKSSGTVIDVIHPETGKTWYYGKSVEECKADYPDAEMMTVDDFCTWKANRQRTPITWEETTQERFDQMLECLPPAAMINTPCAIGFLVGEPSDHDAGSGQPRFQAYVQSKIGNCRVSSRPLTRAEFKREMEK